MGNQSRQGQNAAIQFPRGEGCQLAVIYRLHVYQRQWRWIGCIRFEQAGSEQWTCQDWNRLTLLLIQSTLCKVRRLCAEMLDDHSFPVSGIEYEYWNCTCNHTGSLILQGVSQRTLTDTCKKLHVIGTFAVVLYWE